MNTQHEHTTWHATRTHNMNTQHAHTTWTRNMNTQHEYTTWTHNMNTQHEHATWTRNMNTQHEHATCIMHSCTRRVKLNMVICDRVWPHFTCVSCKAVSLYANSTNQLWPLLKLMYVWIDVCLRYTVSYSLWMVFNGRVFAFQSQHWTENAVKAESIH